MRGVALLLVAAAGLAAARSVHAQAWSLDPAVAPVLVNESSQLSGSSFIALPRGEFFALGSFSHASGIATSQLARFRANGSVDPGFVTDFGPNDHVLRAAPLSDGRVMAVVWSEEANTNFESRTTRLLRLRVDGRRDPTFAALTIEAGTPVLTALADGRILLHGTFSSIGGVARNGLARLNADGTLDAAFAPNLTTSTLNVAAATPVADGSVVISAVSFASSRAPATYYLRRIQPGGGLDSQFVPENIGTTYGLLVVQSDGSVLAGNGNLTRYTRTGAVDRSFRVQIPDLRQITRMVPLPDDRMAVETLIGTSTFGTPAVLRLNRDGQIERDLRQTANAGEGQLLLALLSDGRLLTRVGALLYPLYPSPPLVVQPSLPPSTEISVPIDITPPIFLAPPLYESHVAIVSADFATATPLNLTLAQHFAGGVSKISVDASGRTLVAGDFTQVDGQPRAGLARFTAAGSLDATFTPAAGTAVFVLPDGRPILTRSSLGPALPDGYHRLQTDFVRLDANGAIDPSFSFPTGLDNTQIRWLAAASDGRILIAAFEPNSSREENLKLIWLGPDGRHAATLPTAFTGFYRNYLIGIAATTTPVVTTGGTTAVVVDPTALVPYPNPANPIDAARLIAGGRILITGGFTRVNGVNRPTLARLNADGSLDATYSYVAPSPPPFAIVTPVNNGTAPTDLTPPVDPNAPTPAAPPGSATAVPGGAVIAVTLASTYVNPVLLNDGRTLIFSTVYRSNSVERTVTRLTVNGTPDVGFKADPSLDYYSAAELADGSLFANSRRYLANGALDRNFAPGIVWNDYNGSVSASAIDARGGLWIGGRLDSVDGQRRSSLARFISSEVIGITLGPRSQSVVAGRATTFEVVLGTNQPATFQWTHDGITIAGATTDTLRLTRISSGDAGAYRVTVTVGGRTITSEVAVLTIIPNTSRLVNFSARSRVEAGGPPQVAGVVCATDSPRPVLLRAVGRGVPGTIVSAMLPTPVLTLYEGDRRMMEDRGGVLATDISSLARSVGAFPITPTAAIGLGSLGSALAPTLGSGQFTASTTSGDGSSGLSLFELYDASTADQPPLIRNLAIRGQTAPGADVLTAGFVIAGNGPLTLLLRGIGPALATFGLTGTVADPVLQLFASGARTLDSNDDWGGASEIAAAAIQSGAFPLSAASRDAAMVVTLEPGTYTAQLSGKNGAGGVGMIEIYVIDR